jgi:hypothetical protein
VVEVQARQLAELDGQFSRLLWGDVEAEDLDRERLAIGVARQEYRPENTGPNLVQNLEAPKCRRRGIRRLSCQRWIPPFRFLMLTLKGPWFNDFREAA